MIDKLIHSLKHLLNMLTTGSYDAGDELSNASSWNVIDNPNAAGNALSNDDWKSIGQSEILTYQLVDVFESVLEV